MVAALAGPMLKERIGVGDVPSAWTWLGAAVIIGSGLSIAVKQARR